MKRNTLVGTLKSLNVERRAERKALALARDKQRRLEAQEEIRRIRERTKGGPTGQIWKEAKAPTKSNEAFMKLAAWGSLKSRMGAW